MADRLIVALDVPAVTAARELVRRLDGVVSFYKIGLWLLFAPGAEGFIDELVAAGHDVFLDYKMYDIGETVRAGVARASERGIRFVTVHGDPAIMRAAAAGRGPATRLKVLAVTVLTSLDETALAEMGYGLPLRALIERRVSQAAAAGCDGIIASAGDDPSALRACPGAERLLVVTPGIRLANARSDDHMRLATPAEAIARGADWLVVGRPIIHAADPAEAARGIIGEMGRGLGPRPPVA